MGGGGGMSFNQQKWLMEQSRGSLPPTPIDMRVIMARIARRKAALAAGGYGGTILTGKQGAATATKTALPVPRVSQMRERTLLSTVPAARLGGGAAR